MGVLFQEHDDDDDDDDNNVTDNVFLWKKNEEIDTCCGGLTYRQFYERN